MFFLEIYLGFLTRIFVPGVNMPCFNLKPASIISRLKLKNPIYSETAAYGHMGRNPENKTITFKTQEGEKTCDVETFTWEKLDCQQEVKSTFGL